MNVFEAVKQSITTRQAAEFYGFRVNRTGKIICPFHSDKNPSMKVDNRFHCFGCGADGDVIDFIYFSKDASVAKYDALLVEDKGKTIPSCIKHLINDGFCHETNE